MYDLIIKNGRIIDGGGTPAYFADIAIKNGKIACIGKDIYEAEKIIDATGLTVTPGFIDSHSHSDLSVLIFTDQLEKIEQGITTSIAGQCGSSPAPIDKYAYEKEPVYIGNHGKNTDIYRTMGTFLSTLEKTPLGANIACFVGHRALRLAVIGTENRRPTSDELEKMKELLAEGIRNGALGISFGLIYPPSCYADTCELISLAKVAGKHHALVSAHIRDEGDFLIKSVEEFLNVICMSGAKGILSHHKAAGKENHGKVDRTLDMIDRANRRGFEVYCDVYPYTASHTSLSARFVPKELHSKGDAGIVEALSDPAKRDELKKLHLNRFGNDLSWVLITSCTAYPEYEGLTVPEIAELHKKDCYDTIFDLIKDSENKCNACYFTMCEEDVKTILEHPRAMICTDSGVAGSKKVFHPRLKATFPRVLGKYVREEKVTSLPEMIRKMTYMPAMVYGLSGKGLLHRGFDADICIFDADKIIDRATFTDCNKRAEGLSYVILNGSIVVENAVYNGTKAGRLILRKP